MKILKYDSKLMQSFRLLFDYIACNIVFVITCIPLFTIGTAQTAFYTAIRAMQRGEPWLRLYFHTFRISFKRSTLAWIVFIPFIYLFSCVIYFLAITDLEGSTAPMVCACIVMGLGMCLSALVPLLYSRFEFTVKELLRNSVVMLLAAPIQVILGAALMWAPVVIFFTVPWLFLDLFFWFFVVYFSVAAVGFARLMRYPLGRLADEIPEREPYLVREAKKRVKKIKGE